MISKQYRYKVGDIINGLEILDCIRIKNGKNSQKGYKVKCIKDGYIHEKAEKDLKHGIGCAVCSNKRAIKEINSVAITHPYLINYFTNTEDAYKYSYGSGKKVSIKCLNCDFRKYMSVSDLVHKGFSCPRCSDGKSYPEKFVFNLLEQLKINFKTEYSPPWVKDKRYDFHIPELNCIIETHGEQHYSSRFANIGGRTLKEEQENDKLKKEFAIENNIKHYIVLDCRKSDMEYIKNSILNSELNKLFDLTKIDWLKCHKFACNSRVKEACDLWNSGIESIAKISEIMKVSKSPVWMYLKQGTKLGWCNYHGREVLIKNNRENAQKNKERCGKKCKITLEDEEIIYNSMKECLEKNNFSRNIFDKLVKSKEPYKPFYKQHKHLEGMKIEYI